jgi:hypothetical protein
MFIAHDMTAGHQQVGKNVGAKDDWAYKDSRFLPLSSLRDAPIHLRSCPSPFLFSVMLVVMP